MDPKFVQDFINAQPPISPLPTPMLLPSRLIALPRRPNNDEESLPTIPHTHFSLHPPDYRTTRATIAPPPGPPPAPPPSAASSSSSSSSQPPTPPQLDDHDEPAPNNKATATAAAALIRALFHHHHQQPAAWLACSAALRLAILVCINAILAAQTITCEDGGWVGMLVMRGQLLGVARQDFVFGVVETVAGCVFGVWGWEKEGEEEVERDVVVAGGVLVVGWVGTVFGVLMMVGGVGLEGGG